MPLPTLSAAACRSSTTRCRAPQARQPSQRGRPRRAAVQHAWRITRNPAPLAGRRCLQCAGGGPFAPTCVALAAVVAFAAAAAVRSRVRRLPRCHRTVIAINVRPLWRWRAHELRSVAAARLPRSRCWLLCGAYRVAPPPPPQLSREATCDHYLSRVCRCPALVSRGNGTNPHTRPHLLIQTKRSLMRAAGGPRLMER